MAERAHTTRRALFAAATVFPLLMPAFAAASPTGLSAWREGFGILATDDGVWLLVREAHRQGFRPDQVTSIVLSASSVGPVLSLMDDQGETVRIYPDHTLRLHARSGREVIF